MTSLSCPTCPSTPPSTPTISTRTSTRPARSDDEQRIARPLRSERSERSERSLDSVAVRDSFDRPARRATRAVLGDAPAPPLPASATDGIVERVFQELLGRSSGSGGFWHEFAAQKQREGVPLAQIESEMRAHVKASDEYQALHATDILVDDAFRELLQRESGGAGFWHDFAKQKQSEGMSLDDIDREVRMHLRASDEYGALHPSPGPLEGTVGGTLGGTGGGNGRAEAAFVHQPNGWTCGPTSLTMALAHHGLGAATPQRALQIAAETGTGSAAGFPGGVALMASEARARGLQATHSSTRDVSAMRAQLEQGRSLIVNGTDVGSGVPHFVYIAGLADDGSFIVNDPITHGTQRWSSAQLHSFTHGGANPPGFAAVWT